MESRHWNVEKSFVVTIAQQILVQSCVRDPTTMRIVEPPMLVIGLFSSPRSEAKLTPTALTRRMQAQWIQGMFSNYGLGFELMIDRLSRRNAGLKGYNIQNFRLWRYQESKMKTPLWRHKTRKRIRTRNQVRSPLLAHDPDLIIQAIVRKSNRL